MSSLVLELQRDAMNHDGSVLSLLRKTVVVSTKLSMSEVRQWAKSEIEGYKTPVPPYRKFASTLKSETIYGWQTVSLENLSPKERKQVRSRLADVEIARPIAEIEAWLTSSGPNILYYLAPEKSLELGLDMPTALFIPRCALYVVPEAIRNHILNWSLELEDKGILGEGMTFTAKEKAQAPSVVTNHFHAPQYQNNGQVGAMGDLAASSVSPTLDLDSQRTGPSL